MKTAIALVLVLVGCEQGRSVTPEDPVARLPLAPLFGDADVMPVGVAVAPDGKRFILDEQRGLSRLDGDRATSIVSMSSMWPSDQPLELPVTDIVALGPDLFAVTALNDGFLLDTRAQTLTQHFCYLPGDDGDTPRVISQRTDALAYDSAAQRLWAQPRTFDAVGTFQFGQIAQYDRTTGMDLSWHPVTDDVHATAAVFLPDRGLVLGQGQYLLAFDPAADTLTRLDDLSRYGIHSIDGLAFDAVSGLLVVADGTTDEVVDLDVTQLSL
jgi:hypothetical protein